MSLVKVIPTYPYAIDDVITLEDAKLFLRVTGDDEDEFIEGLIGQATEFVEAAANIQLCECGYEWRLDSFETYSLKVPKGPLLSIDSIVYVDIDGVEQTLAESVYSVDEKDPTGRIQPAYGESWPSTRVQMNAVTIAYTAGFGDSDDVPQLAKGAIRLLIGHWYRNREAMLTGTISKEIELGVQRIKWLLRRY